MHPLDAPAPDSAVDFRWLGPLAANFDSEHLCPCGSDQFIAVVSFSNYKIAGYMTEGRCLDCGALVLLPTEIDDPAYDEWDQ